MTAVAKAAFNSAVDAVRAGGRVVAVGLPPEAMSLDIPRLVLDGIDRVRGPLAPGEPAAQEVRRPTGSPQATPDPSVTSTAPAVWQPSPEIERLLAAAREGSPAALETDAQQRVAAPAAEPRTQAPLDIAR